MTAKNITAISKVVTQEALEAVSKGLKDNIWCVPSRYAPNAEKLKDGAVQRISVAPSRYSLHVKTNPEKIGFYKRPELNERASGSAYVHFTPWETKEYRHRIARIY